MAKAIRERKFNGVTFTRLFNVKTKVEAEKTAKRRRSKPNPQLVRIVKTDKGYTLYQK